MPEAKISGEKRKVTFAGSGWDWSDYYSFTMIRNPWDRIVSAYEYGRQTPESILHQKIKTLGSFAAFVEADPIRPIEQHAFDLEGRQLVNAIVRLEDIAESLPPILKALDLAPAEIPQKNGSVRRPYRDYYDGATRAVVRERYALDISLGGYRF